MNDDQETITGAFGPNLPVYELWVGGERQGGNVAPQ
jgi:hypothetical protein